jgi:putative peptidoglycan lipid II flippase
MSDPAVIANDPLSTPEADPPVVAPAKSFLRHAKLIGGLTLISRIVGLARDIVAAHFFGAGGVVANAFSLAFIIPNLFRKLLGEGALSAAFIPLYAQARRRGVTDTGEPPGEFAAASVNLLAIILVAVTIVGEAIIFLAMTVAPADWRDLNLILKFAAIMLPYVVFVCGGAFLSAILQVHQRFGPPAFAPVLLNVVHIAVVLGGATYLGLHGHDEQTPRVLALQTTLAFWLAFAVVFAGALQVAILLPALHSIGFRFRPKARIWTPAVRRMLVMSIPVALGLGVLQLSVVADKGVSYVFMQKYVENAPPVTHFTWFNDTIRYPLELGAVRRLELAQLMYQFPLGIFAIALATAIFPSLSAEALDRDRESFKRVLRQGIEASLWEGLPASVGLILVAGPAVRLIFLHGQTTPHDADLIARSTMWYAGAIWAFSMLQIINRAFYALHDMKTPLVMSAINLVLNLAIELPLLWTLGESAMAVGTFASFSIQALIMLWLLDRKVGGLDLRQCIGPVLKMLVATAVMGAICALIRLTPIYPTGQSRSHWIGQLILITSVGAGTYFATCRLSGLHMMQAFKRRKMVQS